ncbi:hypothetical protein [Flavisolibacter tropicus]|uniref:Uncharacterized protein n=1 Tax=Flavisolibacter tropicus TaxID=1492898 RepID=A0A172TYY7_9BACT|nr:hypothetical protein [Flavisolibacter tropicus]ANE52309.1 hypothetical protein SY85_19275 [Flavisolibacter tropicus]
MEFIWMIPLYIIMPVTGIILLLKGFNSGKGQGMKRIGAGVILLLLPCIHAFLLHRIENGNEKSLIGSYTLDSTEQAILKLYPDNTFEFAKVDSTLNYGKGKWQYRRWDIDEVALTFNDSTQLSFQVVNQDKENFLQTTFWTGTEHKYIKLVKSIKNR